MTRRLGAAGGTALLCVLALAGCGLSPQPQPEQIPRQLLPTSLDGESESPSPTAGPSPRSAD